MSLTALLMAMIASGGGSAHAESKHETEPSRPTAVRTIRGDALVLSGDDALVIAIDEKDRTGGLDGKIDHILYMQAADLQDHPFSYRDAAAEIEIRRFSLRALLPTLGQHLQFRLLKSSEAIEEPLHLGMSVEPRVFKLGSRIYLYSGEKVEELTFAEVERSGAHILRTLWSLEDLLESDPSAIGIDPLRPPIEAETGGGGCKSTCSISCGKGSCAAACLPGYCANCKCLNEPPATSASCYCL